MTETDGQQAGGPSSGEPPADRAPADQALSASDAAASSSADGAPDAAAVLAFLRDAPPEVRDWLLKSAALPAEAVERPELVSTADVGTTAALAAGRAGRTRATASDADEAAEPLDERGLDADDLDEDDDILARPRRAKTSTKASRHSRRGHSLAIVIALVAGVALGWWVWQSGRPEAEATPTMTAASDDTGADATARVAELAASLAENPDDADAHLELGVLLFNAGDLDAAAEQWERVTELDPTGARAWYNLGFYHLSTDPADMAAAQTAWEKVIDLDPDSDLAKTVTTHMAGLMGTATAEPTASSTPTDSATAPTVEDS